MFFFGHTGITAGVVQGINHANRGIEGRAIDLRKAMLLGILPDLLDKPVALLYPNVFGNHTRLCGHSLVISLVVLAALLLTLRRRHGRRAWRLALVLWGCMLGHFLLDRIWINDLHAFFWPFWPTPEPLAMSVPQRWLDAVHQPWTIFGETTGLVIWIFLIRHYKLHRGGRFKQFLRTGILPIRAS